MALVKTIAPGVDLMVKYPTIDLTINEAGIANKIVTSKNIEVVNDKVEITAKKNLSLAEFILSIL